MKYIASFSGGKDSTAMVLRLIEEKWPLDEIVFFDTGWEFPQMDTHIDKFEQMIGRSITRLHPRESFDYIMCERPIIRRKKSDPMHGKVYRNGNGWPSYACRWCTREKITVIDNYCGKDSLRYVGIAYDESDRIHKRSYPLIEWKMTEKDCLLYCQERGFTWGGLYDYFDRVSCFCCPLKGLKDYRILRRYFPDLWAEMLAKSLRVKTILHRRFHHGKTIAEIDARFENEDKNSTQQDVPQ